MCVAALGIIGAVVGAAGSLMSGMMAAQASRQQADAYERQAYLERQQAQFNADQQTHKAIKVMSQQRTASLAAGVSVSEGTPLALIEDTALQASMDRQAIIYNGQIKEQNFKMQAASLRTKAAGQEIGGVFGALSPMIKGISGAAGGDFSFGGSSQVAEPDETA